MNHGKILAVAIFVVMFGFIIWDRFPVSGDADQRGTGSGAGVRPVHA